MNIKILFLMQTQLVYDNFIFFIDLHSFFFLSKVSFHTVLKIMFYYKQLKCINK